MRIHVIVYIGGSQSVVPKLAAPPGNLLYMQLLDPTSELLNRKLYFNSESVAC